MLHHAVNHPRGKSIVTLFEEQVARSPEATAVIAEDQHMTYRELNQRASLLAHHLCTMGVGPEVRVGVFLPRSFELVISLFAILKAGGIYVPFDPTYPPARLGAMLQDAQPLVLLTRQPFLRGWERERWEGAEAQVVCLERFVEHHSLLNLCLWYKRYTQMTEHSVVLLLLPPVVDASLKNILTPLIAGAHLVLVPSDHLDTAEIVSLIEQHKVTVVNSAPSVFGLIVEAAKSDHYKSLSSLQHVLLGGDTLLLAPLREWLKSHSCHCQLSNIYGPTECTDIAASYTVKPEDIERLSVVPIGLPIDHVRVYILNEDGHLAPPGGAGELYLAGACLARGYLNKEALTAATFVPDLLHPKTRMYKTGDRVRSLADGNLVFLGRLDHQVKIHGQRIELSEIEMALKASPGVREAVVLAREDQPGEKRLVAYVVPQPEQSQTPTSLRGMLQRKLPEYMLPFILLRESLPLTNSGKVDRRALASSVLTRPQVESPFVPPRTQAEEHLAAIWAEVLHLDKVGIHDNFFDLGGDSLLGIQVVTRVRAANFPLTTKLLFQYQTIAQLATVLATDILPGPSRDRRERGEKSMVKGG